MKLSNYISDLLYRYECVIVPDFGGFVTNTQSAIISSYSKTFYPPHKQITYNSHLKNNDGLLANYIASVDKMPFEHAMNFIRFEVSEWRKELNETDLFLEKIGKLSLDKNEAIIFEPQNDTNYLTAAYGLSSFVTPEIKRETYIKQVEKLEEKAPILISEHKKEAPDYLKYAAIFVIGLSVLGFGGNEIYKNYKNRQQIVVAQKQQKQIEDKIQKATFIVTESLPSIHLDVTLDKRPYHVIAGAFRYPENAVRKVNQLKEKGYNARILGINQWGLTQVSFDSYDNRRDALNNLYRLKKIESEEVWLLVQDL
jgi:hypothetical protein